MTTKDRLIKRLKWYYPTERMHTYLTFPALAVYVLFANDIHNSVFILYGLFVCTVILYQGQRYWKLKLDRLLGNTFDQEKQLHFFRSSKKLNIVLIGLMPVAFLLQQYLLAWKFNLDDMLAWGITANLFAILEHINYYHIQLMVDNKYDWDYLNTHKRLKKSGLAKGMEQNKI